MMPECLQTLRYKRAKLKKKLCYKELLLGEEWVPQVILEDPTYTLLPYVIKEYDACRSNEEVVFNQMLRSTRNQIECAFWRLKARWRILQRRKR